MAYFQLYAKSWKLPKLQNLFFQIANASHSVHTKKGLWYANMHARRPPPGKLKFAKSHLHWVTGSGLCWVRHETVIVVRSLSLLLSNGTRPNILIMQIQCMLLLWENRFLERCFYILVVARIRIRFSTIRVSFCFLFF